jgi:DNA-binding Xre family transcriptional regulator
MKRITYMKLWHLLLDRHLTKKDLKEMSGVSTTSIAKMVYGKKYTD